MEKTRRRRLVTIHIPGEQVRDEEGFLITTDEQQIKVWCEVSLVKPDEIFSYSLDKLIEMLRCRCSWNRVKNLNPKGAYFTVQGKKYELWGPFVNEGLLNITARFEGRMVS